MATSIDRSTLPPLAILIAAIGALGGAYGSQYLGDLQPCKLCLYQRWPWWIALAVSGLAVLLRGRPVVAMGAVVVSSLAILGGAGIAGFHVGVEQHWWEGLASCGGTGDMPTTVEALRRQIMSAPVIRCDEVAWSLLGVSMAGYNFLISLGLGAGGLWVLWRKREMLYAG